MSVLIRGMEMPENCLVCFIPCSLLCDLDDYERKRIRHPECPCVEIPTPHGRLIDADELLKHKTDHEMISTHLVWNAPTVIEEEQ